MPIATKATVIPNEYAASRMQPRTTVRESAARARIAPRTTPTHGAAQTANAAPRSAREPLARARPRAPGASIRSGQGSKPANASPRTTSTNPAIFVRVSWSSHPPSAAAPAPRTTKTTVKPSANGTLAATTRRAEPRSPRRSTSTDEIADRYPGTSGSTHGKAIETRPAANAAAIRSAIEARELFVEPALLVRPERVPVLRPALRRRLRLARPRPPPREDPQDRRAAEDADQRQQPCDQVEAVARRRRQDSLPPLRDEPLFDLAAAVARRDPLLDLRLDALCCRRVRLRQRLALADRAHQLSLELGEGRMLLAGQRRRGQEKRRDRDREQPHERSARSTASRISALLTSLITCSTTVPLRSMKNVSGSPVSPYTGEVTLWLSCTSGQASPYLRANRRASPLGSLTSPPSRTARPGQRLAAAASAGASCLHGKHHEAQKLSTTTLPRSDASCSVPGPSSRRSSKSGARFPIPTFFPLPWTSFHTSSASSRATSPTATTCAPSFSLAVTSAHAETTKTVVPTVTWLKSHSASEMCMRMQPCEAE